VLIKDVVQRCWKDKNPGTWARTEVRNGRHKIEHLVVIAISLQDMSPFCFLVPPNPIMLVSRMSTFSGIEYVFKEFFQNDVGRI
jgi:hypothetical protein